MINPAVAELAAELDSTAWACALLGRPWASHYRAHRPARAPAQRQPRASPSNALTSAEQDAVIAALTSPRFCDKSVAQTWATLLDEGIYLASMSTMHRLLRLIGQAGDRRNQATHPAKTKPELMATRAGQVWSWDITKLRGPDRGVYYDLYVILDIYSRYVLGWTVAAREDSEIAKNLIQSTAKIHGAPTSLHPDRGTSMTSKPVCSSWSTWASYAATADRTSATTTPTAKLRSRPSSTPRRSPAALGPWLVPARSARTSSPTTTTNTGTPGSPYTPPRRSTTAPPTRSANNAEQPCTRPTPPPPDGFDTAAPNPQRCRPQPRSTSPAGRPSNRAPSHHLSHQP